VGYAIRFDAKCSSRTIIKYTTDSLLIRETLLDPLLSKYSVIIVDEAHERSLYTDVLFGLLKKIKRKRPDLRVIIASATLNAAEIRDFFQQETVTNNSKSESASILSITGRVHDLDILYLEEPTHNFISTAVKTVVNIHKLEEYGDILVFLPRSEDINSAIHMIEDQYPDCVDLILLPLYSSLPHRLQAQVMVPTPPKSRKVVFATDMAESSVTIDGVKYVIDCGFSAVKYFDPVSGVGSLTICPEAQSSAW
jgi:ATP-dependent RNA helicase DDX35